MDPKTESRIRDRAYQMWLEDGSPHGQADAYWFRAEQEVLSAEAMDAAQVSAHEEGPDRDAERIDAAGDVPTAGEAGPGHPQKPGEALQPSAPITAPKQRARIKAATSPSPSPSPSPVPEGDASAGPASSYGASSNAPAEAAAAAESAGTASKPGRGRTAAKSGTADAKSSSSRTASKTAPTKPSGKTSR